MRAKEVIEQAEVVLYDYLCNPEMLAWAPEGAEIIYVGKKAGAHTLRQEEINALIVEKTRGGKRVVRLKGGDPFVFGRGGEEAVALAAAGAAFEIVPGVSSTVAGPAYAGIPVTQRGTGGPAHDFHRPRRPRKRRAARWISPNSPKRPAPRSCSWASNAWNPSPANSSTRARTRPCPSR